MVTCLNCDMVFEGTFCSSYGQKATTQRINWQSFIWELPLGTVAASFGVMLLGFLLFFTMPLLFYWYQLIFVL